MIKKEYVAFFSELEKNNNREWFHQHKQEYEQHVKKPFAELVECLVPEVEKFEPGIPTDPAKLIFRINRDLRFTKDKTPYNTLMKAGFALGGKKSILPGYYLGIDKAMIHVGGGLFNLDRPTIARVRRLIANESEKFADIVTGASFLETYKELKGEQAQRVNGSLKEALQKTPYVANKQFYGMTDIPLEDYLDSEELPATILSYFTKIRPLNEFLKKAFVGNGF
ncbi:DUF2461 domain-containing protein [Halalkalibaculum sp. DA3122]|uniref:DUF2461 domain-containing protein n=1 Tax=unclassified Halalkalibaculum TaxID=2964617 RepID=UPI003754CDE0